MSCALGWLAVALAGLAGASQPGADGPSITYEFKVMEVRGLQWRASAGTGLKPVTSRGGVTIWTASRDFLKSLPEGTLQATLGAPRVLAYSQAVAHITTRKNHPFVTQVACRGDGTGPTSTTETVREGMAATMAGRCIDQGVLVQLVIEDTDVRSIHTVDVPLPAASASPNAGPTVALPNSTMAERGCAPRTQPATPRTACDASCPASGHGKEVDAETRKAAWHTTPGGTCCADDPENAAECHAVRTADAAGPRAEMASLKSSRSAQVQVPEIGRAEIAGEWLIPRDEVLVVGFGPHTIAGADGKAVVREHLAVIAAEGAPHPMGVKGPDVLVIPKIAAPAPAAPLPVPVIPSRTLPQGVHADGSPAELPPLPDDEKASPAPGDSSEPRPSPQTRKQKSEPAAPAKPAATVDSKAARAAFDLTKGLFKPGLVPQFGVPGLQFVMPLKPFALKLPFNQKLELELIGKVVPDFEPTSQGGSDEN
jgi:hypothetical protein